MTLLADAERDALAEALGRHYVEGRIDADALQIRVEAVYRAQTRDEAEAALADLPAPTPGAPPPAPRRRWWGRRHGEAEKAQPGWRPTPERFRDPTTERVMRVWIDPADGSRHYVAEG
jgi:Domain of unknown function (DUF1707)